MGTKGLGKGLGALFTDIDIDSDAKISTEEILFIDINDIKPNASQPRKSFDDETIDELAQSIMTHGVIQPVMLRKAGEAYELVAGERRWRAARKANVKSIPAIVRELTEEQNSFFALIENMQREDLNPLDEAVAMKNIIDNYALTQEELSKSVGKSRPYITNSLRLLKLPTELQGYIISGELTAGHGKVLAAIREEDKQVALARKIVKRGLSVREAEHLINDNTKKKNLPRQKNSDIISVEDELTSILGTKVTLNARGNRGKIELNYYSRDELDGLIDALRKLK